MSDTALPVIVRFDTTANRMAFTPSPGVPEQLYVWLDSDDQPNAYYWDGAAWQVFNGASGSGNVNAGGTLTLNALVIGQGSTDVATTTTGTGILTALGINVGSAGAPVLFNGAGGTPSSLTLTNATGLVTAGINASQVTLAKIQNAGANSVLVGSGAAGSGAAYSEIALGTNLSMSGTTLNASGGSGSLVLLTTLTASSSASLDFTGISSTYETYFFDITELIADTSTAAAWIRMGTGAGPSWDTGSNYSYAFNGWSDLNTPQTFGNSADTKFFIGNSLGTAATTGLFGQLWVRNVNSATGYKHLTGEVQDTDSAGNFVGAAVFGKYKNTTAVTGVQFLMSSGNIASGVVRVYGLSK